MEFAKKNRLRKTRHFLKKLKPMSYVWYSSAGPEARRTVAWSIASIAAGPPGSVFAKPLPALHTLNAEKLVTDAASAAFSTPGACASIDS
jgi:hypothetical protein